MGTFGDYWGDNWPALLPAIIFLVVNPWSILALIRSASARRERAKVAWEEFVDQVEVALISGNQVSHRSLYILSDAIAERRQMRVEELHRPVSVLRQVARRLQRNPALSEAQKNNLQHQIDSLVREIKSVQGLAILEVLEQELTEPPRDYRTRDSLAKLIRQLADFAYFEDEPLIRQVTRLSESQLRNSLRNPTFIKDVRNVAAVLRTIWTLPACSG